MAEEIKIKKFDEFVVGTTETITVSTNDETVQKFADLTTDRNPLHVNEEWD